ncbi:hypothetical protein GQ44DRAFT_832739 [Phaeosphaeriaceae sp. PMI808]|nr:hypothetical protein GQ44DRAFT_832739 [Phaeosphaeriaceae sp. PMI808]
MEASSPFYQFLFCNTVPRYSQRRAALRSLFQSPSQIAFLLDDEDTKNQFFVEFSHLAERLADIFEDVAIYTSANPNSHVELARELLNRLILPLLMAADEVDHDILAQVIVATLGILIEHIPSSLQALASTLVQNDVFQFILSDKKGGRLVQNWLRKHECALVQQTQERWTDVVVAMCIVCVGSHATGNEIHQWQGLVAARRELAELKGQLDRRRQIRSQANSMASMRLVTEDDIKTNKVRSKFLPHSDRAEITLSAEVNAALVNLGLSTPHSEAALLDTLQTLQREEREILQFLVDTFPCRLCNDTVRMRSNVLTPLASTGAEPHTDVAAQRQESGLHGQRIGAWKVLLSAQALKDIQLLGHSGNFGPVNNKLAELASGCWSGKAMSKPAGLEIQRQRLRVPLLRATCMKNHFILWQVDVGFDEDTARIQQHIKVWKIGDYTEILRAVDAVTILQKYYLEDEVQRCIQRPPRDQVTGKYVPASFLKTLSITSADAVRMDVQRVDMNIIEMSNKFYALTEPVIRAVLSNSVTAEFPFDISEDEVKIINHFDTASLILGRSGTGKTTCLVFKLLAKFLSRQFILDEKPLRQVLLTRSEHLSAKLRVYIHRLIETRTSKALFLERPEEPEIEIPGEAEDFLKEETLYSLKESHFPLVCTFDQFLRILENTVTAADRKNFVHGDHIETSLSSALLSTERQGHYRQPQVVDFHTFRLDYWSRFLPTLTKSLPVELVFPEIIGIIKGSTLSSTTLLPLSQADYFSYSSRLAPMFSAESQRSRVYELFLAYEKLKKHYGDVDYVDRVVSLLKSVREKETVQKLFRLAFDELYIDEVQDQRSIDIELVLNIVKDPRGIHFAGDTAQSISKDSTFRFEDIKALIHQHFLYASKHSSQSDIAKPAQFFLSQNYRSHQGILSLASLVMQMLWTGFPETVDKLAPEVGRLVGPRPTIFVGFGAEVLSAQMVGLVQLHERVADFGAEQVILVPDKDAKMRLQAQIGDAALVLTILQSKGMEFDDVILYNFFSESSCPSSIRCLGSLVSPTKEPFDRIKHAALCSELKHLYVAITRARITLSIIESSETRASDIVKVFTQSVQEPLIDVVKPGDPNEVEKLKGLRSGKSVDPWRWSLRGQQFLHERNFKDAKFCFDKARDDHGGKVAQAFIFQDEGRLCRAAGDDAGFTQNLQSAIHLFLQLKYFSNAVANLESLSQFKEAAHIWLEEKQYHKAAGLFRRGGLFKEAASAYHLCGNHNDAAISLRHGQHFDELVEYLKENREHLDIVQYRGFTRLCALLIKQNKISSNLRALAISLLGTFDEQEKFFKEYSLTDQLAGLYETHDKYTELFQLCLKSGATERALHIAQAHRLPSSAEPDILQALHYVEAGSLAGGLDGQTPAALMARGNDDTPLSPSIRHNVADWAVARSIVAEFSQVDKTTAIHTLQSPVVKGFVCFHILINLPKTLKQATDFEYPPFRILPAVVWIVRKLLDDAGGGYAWHAALLISGVFTTSSLGNTCRLLSWSPLKHASDEKPDALASSIEYPNLAKTWVLDRFASAIACLDGIARGLWSQLWPTRCFRYLTQGNCIAVQMNQCRFSHEKLNSADCSRMIKTSILISSIFCSLTSVYYNRAMNKDFQENFLPRRRHWLERLLREVTYVSSLQHDPLSISQAQMEHFHGREASIVASGIEDLLFFRLREEYWESRRSLSALLEQIQMAQNLGLDVYERFYRSVMRQLSQSKAALARFPHEWNVCHDTSATLRILCQLEWAIYHRNQVLFNSDLGNLIHTLQRAAGYFIQPMQRAPGQFPQPTGRDPVWNLTAFHAILSILEYLATYLVFVGSSGPMLMPQSWATFHLPLVADGGQEVLTESENYTYRCSLQLLLHGLCGIFSNLQTLQNFDTRPTFTIGSRTYPMLLLRRRMADFMATILLNLGCAKPMIRDFKNTWIRVREIFELPVLRAQHFQHSQFEDLAEIFARSFQIYNGKDSLIIVTRDSNNNRGKDFPASYFYLQSKSVKAVPFTSIKPQHFGNSQESADSKVTVAPKAEATPEADDEQRQRETTAVVQIQAMWRRRWSRIRDHRTFLMTPFAKTVKSLCIGDTCDKPFNEEFTRLAQSQDWVPNSQQYHKERILAIKEEIRNEY